MTKGQEREGTRKQRNRERKKEEEGDEEGFKTCCSIGTGFYPSNEDGIEG